MVGIRAYFLAARRRGASRFLSPRGALELVDSDFAGLPTSYTTDKELCRECIISNFTPSYPHKYKEYNITRFLRRGTPMECLDVSLKARTTQDGQQLANNIVMLGAGLALLGSKK